MEKIRNLDEIIKEIENCDYIDCHKDEIFDDYQYENILYYFKQFKKQKEIIEKAIELLGNYKHYSTPDEKQNGDNEDLVNNAFDALKEVSE